MRFAGYDTEGFFDEMMLPDGTPRDGARRLAERIESLSDGELQRRQVAAESSFMNLGITFTVYGDQGGSERIFPFDVVPRIVPAEDWGPIERGLAQRITALNLFLDDVYHDRKIVADGVVPAYVIESASGYLEQCVGLSPPHGVWCHIAGSDLIRDGDGTFYVLEDNMRCPSGVSYVLENRAVMKRTWPAAFSASRVRAVDDYPSRLLETLSSLAPDWVQRPRVVVLTPGIFNSAYFEHAFLAQRMGQQLVEGRDLVAGAEGVFMRTTQGFERVDVIYRRIDDTFLDPKTFNPDSMLGVPGLMDAYRAGTVALANAPGTGVADDKVVYAYVPEIIRYYLAEDPIIPNVETFMCWDDTQRAHVVANMAEMVVKAANESGGYGMLVGPASTEAQREEFARRIEADPRNYIAQPVISLSRAPVLVDDHFEGRHVDLRPFILHGQDAWVLPGGLTRVALTKGSLVVNSSQGGGSKDTWVLS